MRAVRSVSSDGLHAYSVAPSAVRRRALSACAPTTVVLPRSFPSTFYILSPRSAMGSFLQQWRCYDELIFVRRGRLRVLICFAWQIEAPCKRHPESHYVHVEAGSGNPKNIIRDLAMEASLVLLTRTRARAKLLASRSDTLTAFVSAVNRRRGQTTSGCGTRWALVSFGRHTFWERAASWSLVWIWCND